MDKLVVVGGASRPPPHALRFPSTFGSGADRCASSGAVADFPSRCGALLAAKRRRAAASWMSLRSLLETVFAKPPVGAATGGLVVLRRGDGTGVTTWTRRREKEEEEEDTLSDIACGEFALMRWARAVRRATGELFKVLFKSGGCRGILVK